MQRLTDWLDEYLADVGVVGAAEVGFGILAGAGIFSLVFVPPSVEFISVAAVLVGLAGLMTLVIAGRATYRRRSEVDHKLLVRYCDVLSDQMQSSWRLLKWEQHTVINHQGDARQTISASGAVKSFKLSYYRIRVGAGWNQPKKYQNNVKVHVRSIELEGVPGAQAAFPRQALQRRGRAGLAGQVPSADEGQGAGRLPLRRFSAPGGTGLHRRPAVRHGCDL